MPYPSAGGDRLGRRLTLDLAEELREGLEALVDRRAAQSLRLAALSFSATTPSASAPSGLDQLPSRRIIGSSHACALLVERREPTIH